MGFFQSSVRGLFLTLIFIAVSSTLRADDKSALEKKLEKLYDDASADPVLGPVIDTLMSDALKHDLDLKVDQILRKHPVAQALLPQIEAKLDLMTEQIFVQLANSYAVAMELPDGKGQYAEELQLLKEGAKALHFPKSAIDEAKLIVIPTEDINAATWSGFPRKYVYMMMNLGLKRALSTGEKKAVVGHELGHIKCRHMAISALIDAVFYAIGEIVIPNEQRVMLEAALHESVKGFWMHDRDTSPIGMGIVKNFVKSSAAMVTQKLGRKELESLTKDFAAALGVDLKLKNKIPAKEGEESPDIDYKKYQELMAAKTRLQRSEEISADRFGQLWAGSENARMADIHLAGGEGATSEAMDAQHKMIMALVHRRPELNLAMSEDGDHPSIVQRAAQYELFEHSGAYKVYTSPFLRVLREYIGVSQVITELDNDINADVSSLGVSNSTNYRRKIFTDFAKSVSDIIVEEIVSEFKAKSSSFEKFDTIVRALNDTFRNDDYDNLFGNRDEAVIKRWATEIGKPRRLLSDLTAALNKAGSKAASTPVKGALPEVFKDALQVLKELKPRSLRDPEGLGEFLEKHRKSANECVTAVTVVAKK
jgi:hypothetical protein